MEDVLVGTDELRDLLRDHIELVKLTIAKLEGHQAIIADVKVNQAAMITDIKHIDHDLQIMVEGNKVEHLHIMNTIQDTVTDVDTKLGLLQRVADNRTLIIIGWVLVHIINGI